MDMGKRITLDPKQELTIDPRFAAVTEDELTFKYMEKIVSYLDTFTWSHTSVPFTNILWQSVVNPRICVPLNATIKNWQPTSIGFMATPFQYWRGKIIFRIQIVCSNFHRGKLLIFYEPNAQQEVLINGFLDTNKQYAKIIDIQEVQEVDLCVDWAFPKHWATTMTDADMKTSCGSDFAISSTMFSSINGYIGITPFNFLQSPDNSDISVNIFVYGQDLEFNRLTDLFMPHSRKISLAALDVNPRNIKLESLDVENREITCITINPTGMNEGNKCEDFFGEKIVSFRSLLKRFMNGYQINSTATATTVGAWLGTFSIFPAPNPSFTTDLIGNAELFSYLRYAFVCMRGGMRKRMIIYTDMQYNNNGPVNITLGTQNTSTTSTSLVFTTGTQPTTSMNGTVYYVPSTNGGIEFEIPFYSNNYFAWAGFDDPFDASQAQMEPLAMRNYYLNMFVSGTNTNTSVTELFSTAEDFSFTRWLAAPPFAL